MVEYTHDFFFCVEASSNSEDGTIARKSKIEEIFCQCYYDAEADEGDCY